jgi:hypothetical protein
VCDRGNAPGHLEPERADDTIDDLERHAQLSHFLEVADSECWPFQLLLPQLGQRMQTATEQRSHLLRGHRVAGGQAVDPFQAGADPDAWCLAAFGVVGRQPSVPFLGRVQGCDLPCEVVIPRSSCELVEGDRHTHPKGCMPPERSGRPELFPSVHGVCSTWELWRSRGYAPQSPLEPNERRKGAAAPSGSRN